ncbi:MAG TPA: helix-turn-helix transcriptional regulator [Gaiellaceae bacterium]|nr:helix-turn-helix transcriptional regulator [Gaiellaceae bacterium]
MASEEDWVPPEERGAGAMGARVRLLRRSAGLSQADLAAGRFSKEYVSQIERGRTRPTPETLEWLASRLDTDREFLEHGVSKAEAERVDAALGRAEQLVEEHRYEDAVREFRGARELGGAIWGQSLLRLLRGEAWARIGLGELDAAMSLLEEAAALVVTAGFTEADRAEVVFQVGVVRYSESKISEAIVLLDEALLLAESAEGPADRLRSDIFDWRSRCHRRTRDWVAAHEDIERAIELAEACSDSRRVANALFQASLVAQRQGRWALARAYAERSLALFRELGDRATVGRLTNNLAGLNHLLGNVGRAIVMLEEAFEVFVELDLAIDAGYVCSSLAEIRLECGEFDVAEVQAQKALGLLGGRVDHLQEVGTAQLTLGKALSAQARLDDAETWIAAAGETFQRASSISHQSYAWIAQGDVESKRHHDGVAASLYRRAVLALHEADAWQQDDGLPPLLVARDRSETA